MGLWHTGGSHQCKAHSSKDNVRSDFLGAASVAGAVKCNVVLKRKAMLRATLCKIGIWACVFLSTYYVPNAHLAVKS